MDQPDWSQITQRLRQLSELEARFDHLERVLWRLEERQSEIIGRLVGARLWPVDDSGRGTAADGHANANGRGARRDDTQRSRGGAPSSGASEGSKGGGWSRPMPARNPKVRQDPPRWKGQQFKGKRFSETTSEYLRFLSGFIDWCADRAAETDERTSGGKPRAPYLLDDAKMARAWALVLGDREDEAARRRSR